MANASERKSIRRQEKAASLAASQCRDVIVQLMSTSPGRAWLWDQLAATHMFVTTFSPDALVSAFHEGQRSVGLALLSDIMAYTPDLYIQAMRESHERHLTADTIARAADDSSASADPLAERPGSPLADGGDSGTEPDSEAGPSGGAEAQPGWNPGHDIYVETGSKAN